MDIDEIFSRAGLEDSPATETSAPSEVDDIMSRAGIDAVDTSRVITEGIPEAPNLGLPEGFLSRKPAPDRSNGRFVGKDILKSIYFIPEETASAITVPIMHLASQLKIAPEDWGTRWEQTVNKRKQAADLGPVGETVSELGAFGILQATGSQMLKPVIKGGSRLPEAARQGISGYAASSALGGNTLENVTAGALSAAAGFVGAPPPATAFAKELASKGIPFTAGQATGSKLIGAMEAQAPYGPQGKILKEQNRMLGQEFQSLAERAKPQTLANKQYKSDQAYLSDAVDIIDNDIKSLYSNLKKDVYGEYDRLSFKMNNLPPASADNSLGAINAVEKAMTDPKSLVKSLPDDVVNIISKIRENPVASAGDLHRWRLGIDEAISNGLKSIDKPLSRDQVNLMSQIKQGLKADYMQQAQKAGMSKEVLAADARYNLELMPFKDMVESGAYSSRDKVGQVVESIYNGASDKAYMQTKKLLEHMSPEGKEALSYNLAGRLAKSLISPEGTFNPRLASQLLKKKAGQFELALPKDLQDSYEGLNKILVSMSDEAVRAGKGEIPLPGIDPSAIRAKELVSLAATSMIENPLAMKLLAKINKLDPQSDSYKAILKTFLFQSAKQASIYGASQAVGGENQNAR